MNYGQALEKQLFPVATLRRLDTCTDLLNARGASDNTWRVTSLIFSASKLFGRGKNYKELASGVPCPMSDCSINFYYRLSIYDSLRLFDVLCNYSVGCAEHLVAR